MPSRRRGGLCKKCSDVVQQNGQCLCARSSSVLLVRELAHALRLVGMDSKAGRYAHVYVDKAKAFSKYTRLAIRSRTYTPSRIT